MSDRAERAHLTDPEYRRLARAYGQSFDAVAHAAVDIVRERLGQVADIPTTPTRDAASAACAACDGSCGTCPYARPSGKPIPPASCICHGPDRPHAPHQPCDKGCQPDWHRDDCAIYLPLSGNPTPPGVTE